MRRNNNPRRNQEAAEIIEELVRLHSLQTNLFGRLNAIRLEEQLEEQQERNRPRSNWGNFLGHPFVFGDVVRVRDPTDGQPQRGIVSRVTPISVTVQGRRGAEVMFDPNELVHETVHATATNNEQA